jgi:hypothetical protein
MLLYLYNKFVTQPKIQKELLNYLNGLNSKELNSEILWIVNTYSKLLKDDRIAKRLIEKVTYVVMTGKKILRDKNDAVKIQYLFDVVRKYKLVTKFSHRLFSKYDKRGPTPLFMLLATCVCVSLGSLGGAELYRNM